MIKLTNRTGDTRPLDFALMLAVSLIPAVLMFPVVRSGPVWQGDFTSYLLAARDLSQGIDPSWYQYWPIGYPLVLAAFEVVGLSMVWGGAFVNLVAAPLLVVCTWLLIKVTVGSNWFALGGAAVLATYPGLIETAWVVQSDLLFAVLTTSALAILVAATKGKGYSVRSWLMISLLTSAASLMRWPGIALFPSIAISGMAVFSGQGRTRTLTLTSCLLLASSPGAVYSAWRSWRLSGSFAGPSRGDGAGSLTEVVIDNVTWIGSLLVPVRFHLVALIAGFVLAGAVVAAALVAQRLNDWGLLATALFSLIYWLGFTWSVYSEGPFSAEARFALPTLPPIIACLGYLARHSWKLMESNHFARDAARLSLRLSALFVVFICALGVTRGMILVHDMIGSRALETNFWADPTSIS